MPVPRFRPVHGLPLDYLSEDLRIGKTSYQYPPLSITLLLLL